MSAEVTLSNPARAQSFRYDLLAWFGFVHLMAGVAIWYLGAVHAHFATITMGCVLWLLCHLSITIGSHRLYAHASYKANFYLQVVIVVINAATFQSSILWWSGYHIRHHAYSDTERDPYTIRHGFWWAHWLWALYAPNAVPPESRRLMRNKVLLWQHAYYLPLAIVVGIIFPTALAALWGDWFGGLLIGGFLRLVAQYHGTWAINSVAHAFGPWRYSRRITARTCYWVAAFTVGEWNHEGHHHAEEDYRLGNRRWYDFDPGGWLIYILSLVGLTYNLKRVSDKNLAARIQAAN